MRGGTRVAAFFCSVFTASMRACLRSLPSATSRAVLERARSQSTPRHVPRAERVDDREPRDAERERQARHPRGDQEQRRAEELQPAGETAARRASRRRRPRSGAAARIPMQRRQPAARDQHQHEAADAHGGVRARAALALGRDAGTASSTTRRASRETGTPAGRTERRARPRSTRRSGPMRLCTAPDWPVNENPGSVGRVGGERHEQHEREHAQRNDCALAQPTHDGRSEAQRIARLGGFSQSLSSRVMIIA